jgi:hypothetical protein
VILDPKVIREKLELEILVILDLRGIREISVSKEILELVTLDQRVIRENWVSIKIYFYISILRNK